MKTIAIDFDGVLHSYTSGWTGPVPTDPPVPGAQTFIRELQRLGWTVVVFTARVSKQHDDWEQCLRGVYQWLLKHDFPCCTEVTAEKPAALVYVDDRGYRFQGDFSQVLSFVSHKKFYQPWNKPTGKDWAPK